MSNETEIVIDASSIMAVLINEPEKRRIVELTRGKSLRSPGCLDWEIGNAFSSLIKRKRLDIERVIVGLKQFYTLPIRRVEVDIVQALVLSKDHNIYAYDAYYIQAAKHHACSLLTLDKGMRSIAVKERIEILEI